MGYILKIKRITEDQTYKTYTNKIMYGTHTKVYLLFFGVKVKLVHHYAIRYIDWVILGAYHGIRAATTCKDDKVEGKYIFKNLISS